MSEQTLKAILEEMKTLNQKVGNMDTRMAKVEQSLAKIENDQGTKISALFDGYALRGDQFETLQQNLDDKLDALLLDTNYLVSKSAQHDREIRGLKQAK